METSTRHPKRSCPIRHASLLFLFLLVVFLPAAPLLASDPATDIRDEYLLNTRIGMFLNNYYYNYSPFAAQPITPRKVGHQLIIAGLDPSEKHSRILPYHINQTSDYGHYILTAQTKNKLLDFLKQTKGKAALCILPADWFNDARRLFPASSIITYSRESGGQTTGAAHLKMPYNFKTFRENVHAILDNDTTAAALKQLTKPGLNIIFTIVQFNLLLFFFLFVFVMAVGYLVLCRIRLMSEKTAFITTLGIGLLTGLGLLLIHAASNSPEVKPASLKTIVTRFAATDSPDWKDVKELHRAAIVNQAAFRSLAKKTSIREKLKKGIQDTDKRMRIYSVRTVSFLRGPDLFPLIKDAALNDPIINVRYSAVFALGRIRDHRAFSLLMQIVNEKKDFYTVLQYGLPALANYEQTFRWMNRKPRNP